MHHFIVGYGYCGFYLAEHLLSRGQKVSTLSRHLHQQYRLEGVNHIQADVNTSVEIPQDIDVLYYLVPPVKVGEVDSNLRHFLSHNRLSCKRVVYFGSSGVYGDHGGRWVDELSSLNIKSSRQMRRIDAEHIWRRWAEREKAALVLLRIAGIYGPNRIPIDRAKRSEPIVHPDVAPFINYVYVQNLVETAVTLGQKAAAIEVFNMADGHPVAMGTLQCELAKMLGLSPTHTMTMDEALQCAGDFKKELLQSSKKLNNDKAKSWMSDDACFIPRAEGLLQSLKTMHYPKFSSRKHKSSATD